jgi:hypothetical protein
MKIDPHTKEVKFTSADGKIEYRKKTRTQKSTQMAETDDAYSLVSKNRNAMELVYADYANSMKSLANRARKEMVSTPSAKMDPTAKKKYSREVSSLMAKYNEAAKNAPREREAQRMSTIEVNEQKSRDPSMSKEDLKKYKQRSLSKNRELVGTISRKNRAITITDDEWTAIQSGAISENKLKNILRYTDTDELRQRAMPKEGNSIGTAQSNRIKMLAKNGFSIQEIADKLHIPKSTVAK